MPSNEASSLYDYFLDHVPSVPALPNTDGDFLRTLPIFPLLYTESRRSCGILEAAPLAGATTVCCWCGLCLWLHVASMNVLLACQATCKGAIHCRHSAAKKYCRVLCLCASLRICKSAICCKGSSPEMHCPANTCSLAIINYLQVHRAGHMFQQHHENLATFLALSIIGVEQACTRC